MFRILYLLSCFFIFLNAADECSSMWNGSFGEVTETQSYFDKDNSSIQAGKCLVKYSCSEPTTTTYEGTTSKGFYYRYSPKAKSLSSGGTFYKASCTGVQKLSFDSSTPDVGGSSNCDVGKSVTCTTSEVYFFYEDCVSVNQNFDNCGNEIVYDEGIPYLKTDILNAKYFDDYNNILVCSSGHLQINNSMCIMPDYEKRNLADAILKRDKIVSENNLTDVSGINESSIVYDDNGGIVSYSFSAMDENGAISMVGVTFSETDPVFTVEEDGSITESEYVSNLDDNTSNSNDSATMGDVTGSDLNSLISLSRDVVQNTEDTAHQSLINGIALNNIENSNSQINQHLDTIETNVARISDALEPNLNTPLNNPLENADTYYDDSVIPQVEEMVTNLTNDFNSLKDTYTEKIAYIKENGFEFDYSSQLYETCPLNFTLNPFKDVDNETLTDEEFSLNIDICSLMANAKLPNSEMSLLSIFYVIFYSFFYAVILIGIFKLAALTFRSF